MGRPYQHLSAEERAVGQLDAYGGCGSGGGRSMDGDSSRDPVT